MTPWWPTLFWNWLKILWLKLLWPRLKRICCSLNIPCDLGAARIDTKLKVINWLMISWENIGLMYGIYIYCLLKRLSLVRCVLDKRKRFSGGRSKIVHQFQSHLMMTKCISLKTTSEEARTLLVIWHFFF